MINFRFFILSILLVYFLFANDNYEKGNTKGVSVPSPGVWPVADKDLPELQK